MGSLIQNYFSLLELNYYFQFVIGDTLTPGSAVTRLEDLGWVLVGEYIDLVLAKKILSLLSNLGCPQLSNKEDK